MMLMKAMEARKKAEVSNVSRKIVTYHKLVVFFPKALALLNINFSEYGFAMINWFS